MKRKIGAQPLVYPMPVFVVGTYNSDGTPNAMVAAWGGITEEREITICVSAEHKTVEGLRAHGAFSVGIADTRNMAAADYLGITSGNDVPDKISRVGWHAQRCETVNAPSFAEISLTLECRVKSYDEQACRLVGEIVEITADEAVLDEDGRINADKLRPITYDTQKHVYRVISEAVGEAFKIGKTV